MSPLIKQSFLEQKQKGMDDDHQKKAQKQFETPEKHLNQKDINFSSVSIRYILSASVNGHSVTLVSLNDYENLFWLKNSNWIRVDKPQKAEQKEL
jgi:hypothetical protein